MGLPDKGRLEPRTRSGRLFRDVDFFINSIGEPIHCRHWKPDGEPTALIMLVHGFADHCGRYGRFAAQLNELGLYVFSHDHLRHGENPGDFDILNYKQLIKDTLQHVHIMKAKHPHLPMYIFGHSMGGCISVFAASQAPELFNGVILSAPMLVKSRQFTKVKVVLASAFKNLLPNLHVLEANPEVLTRDHNEVERLLRDRLIYQGPIRLRAAYQLYLMAVNVQPCLSKITHPLLILHGDADKVCPISGSYHLLSTATNEDKKLRVFEGAKHELLLEIDNVPADFTGEVKSWISERLEASTVLAIREIQINGLLIKLVNERFVYFPDKKLLKCV